MAQGKLEVLLVSAKGLDNSDFLSSMDPYVILTCRTQEQKSSIAKADEGSAPEWNETFLFTVTGHVPELHLKLMDKDTFTADDFVGEANIPLSVVFEEGSLPPTSYNVVKDGEFKGEIKVGLTFTPEAYHSRGLPEEEFGWKESSYN
ncbi:elicitor-responsive protein 3-like isoform X1 [Chenopodium quinoa]|uniref:C2 domain-containing protein n=1 Tax=Chenopodium quinoa TaxID=63459 RepID=A0A803M3F9_CHEQI|nr:elicitor-responsive protein 3-like isoform X1 [Chenopodium quinoa]